MEEEANNALPELKQFTQKSLDKRSGDVPVKPDSDVPEEVKEPHDITEGTHVYHHKI